MDNFTLGPSLHDRYSLHRYYYPVTSLWILGNCPVNYFKKVIQFKRF